MAEKVLVGYDSESDSVRSHNGDVICLSIEEANVKELQMKAFYAVLQALTLQSSTTKRSQIIEHLMNEWEIAEETRISIADMIQEKLLTLQQMEESSLIVPKSGQSWGSVTPESLVGKWVRIRMPDDDEFEQYIISAYDAKQEMHHLVTPDLDSMEVDGQYSLVDLREIEDMMWEVGERPNFNAPNQFAATAPPRALCNFANGNTHA